jgi:predicted RNase H-like HicB family nuclease
MKSRQYWKNKRLRTGIDMSGSHHIEIEYDHQSGEYYITWKPPVVIGCGKTREKALKEVKRIARFTIDTMCNLDLLMENNR